MVLELSDRSLEILMVLGPSGRSLGVAGGSLEEILMLLGTRAVFEWLMDLIKLWVSITAGSSCSCSSSCSSLSFDR